MKKPINWICGAVALTLAQGLGAALAQGVEAGPLPGPVPALPADSPASIADAGPAVIDADNMADDLNKRQQIQQSFVFTRTVNGEIAETEQRAVSYSRDDPVRTTESNLSTLDALQAKFDSEVLTRTEAFEEAKLDFVVADLDRDGKLIEPEYLRLVETWNETRAASPASSAEESARERQYRAFVDQLEEDGATPAAGGADSKQKFAFMSGAATSIGREDYLREYLLEFDSMDADADMLLKGDELLKFRALNRGENLDM